jgi:organic hydroperoxide reductase OsmC/OhrA
VSTHAYRGTLTWIGASHGATVSYASYSREYAFAIDGKPELHGSADVPFRGDPTLHNPEELLLAALSSCHMLSWLAECARAGIVVTAYRDEAAGTMSFADGKMRFTEVVLRPHATIIAGDRERALRLHERAHDQCFIASSVNFPVRHAATIEGPA